MGLRLWTCVPLPGAECRTSPGPIWSGMGSRRSTDRAGNSTTGSGAAQSPAKAARSRTHAPATRVGRTIFQSFGSSELRKFLRVPTPSRLLRRGCSAPGSLTQTPLCSVQALSRPERALTPPPTEWAGDVGGDARSQEAPHFSATFEATFAGVPLRRLSTIRWRGAH